MNALLRMLYWFVAGSLIGFGVIAILSIDWPAILLGLVLTVTGVIRLGVREVWGALLGGGLVPLAFLLYDLQNSNILPASTAQTYQLMAMTFGAIAAVGFVWGLIATLLRGRRSAARAD
ncbi:MAG TPA: hypothetical protein VGR57_00345 [Ktedonobacterales bacterium]|nr:hypothetical protein [Ktedonobacterales bacterium]